MSHFIDKRAQTGFADAPSYDKYRPSYPDDAVSTLLNHLGVINKHGARIVELGAGTGKFTELLAARDEEFEIIAVTPQENMMAELERKHLWRVKVIEGDSTSEEIDDNWANAVIAAQVGIISLIAAIIHILTQYYVGFPLVRYFDTKQRQKNTTDRV